MMTTPETVELVERAQSKSEAVHRMRWPGPRQGWVALAVFIMILGLCFAKPLTSLAQYSFHSELYSHILLVPFISAYLIWLKRDQLAGFRKVEYGVDAARPSWFAAAVALGLGFSILMVYGVSLRSGWKPQPYEKLPLLMLAFLSFGLCGAFVFLGSSMLRKIAFPVAFLIFMVPFSAPVEQQLETFLQHGSAQAAYGMISLAQTPIYRQGMQLQLPGMTLEVAPQCSGIHSSLVLFMTSLLAGHLLLRGPWSKLILVIAVIPLAMARNGFRIFLLAQLCIHLDPDWIRSDLHRHGGPLFFVLSLVPFFLLLVLLRRLEFSKRGQPKTPDKEHNI